MGKDEKKHRSSPKSKDSKHKKHKKSHKKSHKKTKDRKKRRDYSSDSDTSSTSTGGDAPPRVNVNTQLAMGRAAARALREILAYNYDLKTEIRQLSRHLDDGNALDISGLADVFLRERLCILFDNILQLKKTVAGHYLRITKASTVASFVAPILEESSASLAGYKVEQATAEEEDAPKKVPEVEQNTIGPSAGPVDTSVDDVETAQPSQLPPQPDDAPPIGAAAAGPVEKPPPPPQQQQLEEEEKPIEVGPRRVLGPAMPPPELLQAAAAAAAAIPIGSQLGGGGGGGCGNDDDGNDGFVVGPPPPEYLIETDAASMDDRSAEVARVMEVLRQHETDGSNIKLSAPVAAGAAPAPLPADAYLILGVDPAAAVGEIKKRYWRLSLLIHPDKCNHPNAAVAFQAVATAAQTLQDTSGRADVDKRREEAELRRFTEEYAAQEERERQWRIAKGTATAEDLNPKVTGKGPSAGGGRDSWMTDLPPEKAATASILPPQGHQTAFSARGPQVRGDTSGWTMTPQQRADAAEAGSDRLLTGAEGAGPALLMAGVSDGSDQRDAAAVAAYNAVARGKSLLEQHLEKQQNQQKKKKKSSKDESTTAGKKRKKIDGGDGGKKGKEDEDDWDREAHPWRPFDREKDLEIKPSGSRDPKELLKNMKGLSSRFAGSGGG
jgi:curved DNA-binding protein CbpA